MKAHKITVEGEGTTMSIILSQLAQTMSKGAIDPDFPPEARVAFMKLNNLFAFLLLSGDKFSSIYDLIAVAAMDGRQEQKNEPPVFKEYREKAKILEKDYHETLRRASGG